MLMKPGPAISSASTHCCTAGRACSAAISAPASSRGFFFCGRASCIAAVQARSPWAACFGLSKAGSIAAPGAISASASPRAARSCSLA